MRHEADIPQTKTNFRALRKKGKDFMNIFIILTSIYVLFVFHLGRNSSAENNETNLFSAALLAFLYFGASFGTYDMVTGTGGGSALHIIVPCTVAVNMAYTLGYDLNRKR